MRPLEKVVDFHTRTPRNTGVLALYNKAEPHALTIEERKQIAEVTINTVAGRLPVIIHVGHPSTEVAVELAIHAQNAGAFGIVCITPYYWSLTQEEIFRAFRAIVRGRRHRGLGLQQPPSTRSRRIVNRPPSRTHRSLSQFRRHEGCQSRDGFVHRVLPDIAKAPDPTLRS